MMNPRLNLAWLALVAAVSLAPRTGQAQRSRADARVLAGHPFMPSVLVRSPFDTRDYHMNLDLGAAIFEIRGLNDTERSALAAQGLNEKMHFALAGLGFDVKQPIYKGLGIRFEVNGTILSGADLDSLIGRGGEFGFSVGGGPFFNIWTGKWVSLSSAIDVLWGMSYNFTPQPVIDRLVAKIDDAAKTGRAFQPGDLGNVTPLLLEKVSNLIVRPRLNLGVGFFKGMGMVVDVAYEFLDAEGDRSPRARGHKLNVGTSLSLNFDVYGVYIPLGLTLAYRLEYELGASKDMDHVYEFGLFYSSGKHFVLGLSAFGSFREDDLGQGKSFRSIEAGARIQMVFYE